MGCDIHLHTEVFKDGTWRCLDDIVKNPDFGEEFESEYYVREYFIKLYRNYELFALLANVRNYGSFKNKPISEPKGLPNDVSDNVGIESEKWGIDGHSHSYHTLADLLIWWKDAPKNQMKALLMKHNNISQETMDTMNKIISVMENQTDNPENIRIVFWFDK